MAKTQAKVTKTQLYRMKCDFCNETSPSFSDETEALAWGAERDYERHYNHNYCKSRWLLQCMLKDKSNRKIERLITEQEAVAEKAKLPQNRSFTSNDEIMSELEEITSNCEDAEAYLGISREWSTRPVKTVHSAAKNGPVFRRAGPPAKECINIQSEEQGGRWPRRAATALL